MMDLYNPDQQTCAIRKPKLFCLTLQRKNIVVLIDTAIFAQ